MHYCSHGNFNACSTELMLWSMNFNARNMLHRIFLQFTFQSKSSNVGVGQQIIINEETNYNFKKL